MSEYTSLAVSKRLAEAGFRAEHENVWWNMGNDAFCGPVARHKQEFGPRDTRLICPAYRTDTLLAWLVGKNYQVAVGKSYDKKRYTAFYTNEVGEQNTRRELSDTIADALAEAVMKVMGVSK